MGKTDFRENVIIIAGRSSGIGEALALQFADRGVWPALGARSVEKAARDYLRVDFHLEQPRLDALPRRQLQVRARPRLTGAGAPVAQELIYLALQYTRFCARRVTERGRRELRGLPADLVNAPASINALR